MRLHNSIIVILKLVDWWRHVHARSWYDIIHRPYGIWDAEPMPCGLLKHLKLLWKIKYLCGCQHYSYKGTCNLIIVSVSCVDCQANRIPRQLQTRSIILLNIALLFLKNCKFILDSQTDSFRMVQLDRPTEFEPAFSHCVVPLQL